MVFTYLLLQLFADSHSRTSFRKWLWKAVCRPCARVVPSRSKGGSKPLVGHGQLGNKFTHNPQEQYRTKQTISEGILGIIF